MSQTVDKLPSIATEQTLSLTRLTPFIGAEVSGVDVAAEQPAEIADALKRALHEYGVLVFRNQAVDAESHRKFAGVFGELYAANAATMGPNAKLESVIDSDKQIPPEPNEPYATFRLHTDASYEVCPPSAAVLRCSSVPTIGGETLWSSMYGAYESLSSHFQRLLDGAEALHTNAILLRTRKLEDQPLLGTTHPVVITDPVTGRRALYVNRNYTARIEGMRDTESEVILRYLYEMFRDPELHTRVDWDDKTLAVWDERVTQHRGIEKFEGHRVLHRITVQGGSLD